VEPNYLHIKSVDAMDFIRRVLGQYRRPVIMSSFGKDSMVMLDLFKRINVKLPILFHREPYFPAKYWFANYIIEEESYSVYDYPPSEFTVISNNGVTEIAKWYDVGKGKLYLPIGISKLDESKPFVCGYWDMYNRPTGTFNFPWDVAFHGHKASDADPLLGALPLQVDVKINDGSVDYAYPLRHFTDEDIYKYTQENGVKWNAARYGSIVSPTDSYENDMNSDYHNACVRCLDPNEPSTVECPILKSRITNISGDVRRTSPKLPTYVGGE
jgi:hypothetical protein